MRIPFNKPFIVGKELEYIAQAVESGHLSGDGLFSKRCHSWLENTLGCQKALLTHSCTGALEMAAMLGEIGPADEIIMPSFTFVSTANAFVLRGSLPVFVDIREDNLNLNEELIEHAITAKTKAIVPVHYAGAACNMDGIMRIAKQYNLMVIEDAAQALLSTYHGRYLGTIGDLGCLSFHETKNIISGEGGALLVNNPDLMERAEILREKGTNRSRFFRGQVDKYTWMDIGSSFLPSELVGAFLFAQLEKAGQIITARNRICAEYVDHLQSLADKGLLSLPRAAEESGSNGHIFYILTRSPKERALLLAHLRHCDILAVFHYVPLHSSPAGRRFCRVDGVMSVTEDISERLVRLPVYYGMTSGDVEYVAKSVKQFYRVST